MHRGSLGLLIDPGKRTSYIKSLQNAGWALNKIMWLHPVSLFINDDNPLKYERMSNDTNNKAIAHGVIRDNKALFFVRVDSI